MEHAKQESSHDTETTRSQWTPEQRLNAGQMAAQALNSPLENTIHEMRMWNIFTEWQRSLPKEENLRRSLYYEARAMQAVALMKVSMVSDAQRIVEERQKQNDPAEQERTRMDKQGYGLDFNQAEMS